LSSPQVWASGTSTPRGRRLRANPNGPRVNEVSVEAQSASLDWKVLEESAAQRGREWAESVRSRLEDESREALGGWPGTISEARARVEAILPRDSEPHVQQREKLTRVLYHAARDLWLDKRVARSAD